MGVEIGLLLEGKNMNLGVWEEYFELRGRKL
jgi:hypothetical protein